MSFVVCLRNRESGRHFVDNSNARFSLSDMIEKHRESLDSHEKWPISHAAEVAHVDKNQLFSSNLHQPVQTVATRLTDTCWTDLSSGVNIVPNVRENATVATPRVNTVAHLLVNPRIVAPVVVNDTGNVAVSAMSVADQFDTAHEVEPSAKVIKIEPVSDEYEMLPADAQIVPSTDNDHSYSAGTALLAPVSLNGSSSVGTMQVLLQLAPTVGNLMQTGGNVCFVVEPQTLCPSAVAPNSDTDDVSTAASQSVATDVSVKEKAGSQAYEKPTLSYGCLIAMALKNSVTGSLPVNEIYAYIV